MCLCVMHWKTLLLLLWRKHIYCDLHLKIHKFHKKKITEIELSYKPVAERHLNLYFVWTFDYFIFVLYSGLVLFSEATFVSMSYSCCAAGVPRVLLQNLQYYCKFTIFNIKM